MRVAMKSWILAFLFLILIWAGSANAEGEKEHWKGPGWYTICDTSVFENIVAEPFTNEAECKTVLPVDDDLCHYYCVYVDNLDLRYYESYY